MTVFKFNIFIIKYIKFKKMDKIIEINRNNAILFNKKKFKKLYSNEIIRLNSSTWTFLLNTKIDILK